MVQVGSIRARLRAVALLLYIHRQPLFDGAAANGRGDEAQGWRGLACSSKLVCQRFGKVPADRRKLAQRIDVARGQRSRIARRAPWVHGRLRRRQPLRLRVAAAQTNVVIGARCDARKHCRVCKRVLNLEPEVGLTCTVPDVAEDEVAEGDGGRTAAPRRACGGDGECRRALRVGRWPQQRLPAAALHDSGHRVRLTGGRRDGDGDDRIVAACGPTRVAVDGRHRWRLLQHGAVGKDGREAEPRAGVWPGCGRQRHGGRRRGRGRQWIQAGVKGQLAAKVALLLDVAAARALRQLEARRPIRPGAGQDFGCQRGRVQPAR